MFEPFEVDGLEYVKSGCGSMWSASSPIKLFDTKELAQAEADKWNTGLVVELKQSFVDAVYNVQEPDFVME